MKRQDKYGEWVSEDGVGWLLETPSDQYAELTVRDPGVVPKGPLQPVGALATLLAVTETLTVDDAAKAVGLEPEDLVHEAEAWQLVVDTTP
jgi:hypothetical protein